MPWQRTMAEIAGQLESSSMKKALRLLKWVIKACIFFTLFAFALNNQHEASVHLFFGHQWRSPMVLIVLAAFASGMVVGVLGMAPRRWRRNDATIPAAGMGHAAGGNDATGSTLPPHGL